MSDELSAESIAFFQDPKNLRVERNNVTDGKVRYQVGCHHRADSSRPYGYCGGCAARAYMALNVIEKLLLAGKPEEALKVISAKNAAVEAEAR